jgi:hypothetical protein
VTEKKTKAVKTEKAAVADKPKGSRAWIYATVGVAAALIGGVVFYGQVIYPDVRKEQIAKNDIIACEGFYKALRAEKIDVDDAFKKVLNASDDAIDDPAAIDVEVRGALPPRSEAEPTVATTTLPATPTAKIAPCAR